MKFQQAIKQRKILKKLYFFKIIYPNQKKNLKINKTMKISKN